MGSRPQIPVRTKMALMATIENGLTDTCAGELFKVPSASRIKREERARHEQQQIYLQSLPDAERIVFENNRRDQAFSAKIDSIMIIADAQDRGLLSKHNLSKINKQIVETSEEIVRSTMSIRCSMAEQTHQKSLGHKMLRNLPEPLPSNQFFSQSSTLQIYHPKPNSALDLKDCQTDNTQ